MQEETKLEQVLRLTLNSMQEKDYSPETIRRYRMRFNVLNTLARKLGIDEPSEGLFQEYLNDNKNRYTGEYTVFRHRQHVRTVNLIKSYISDGVVDTSRRCSKSASDCIRNESFREELESFVQILKNDNIQPNTICTYKRIAAYFLIYCEEKGFSSLNEMSSGDIRNFILYLYDHNYFKPTTITSGLSGLRQFLSLHENTKNFIMELPTRLPRERKIIEIYNDDECDSIKEVLAGDTLTKRNKAICLLLIETGIRAVDVCNIKLTDIDWNKDIIYIHQQKTGVALNIPLRSSYGNAIADYLLKERPSCKSKYLFVRELAPFDRLDGDSASIREIVRKMEISASIYSSERATGSRTTRHNAASALLRSGVAMSDISAVLGHTDPNIVSVYLSTDEKTMAACTLPLPGGAFI